MGAHPNPNPNLCQWVVVDHKPSLYVHYAQKVSKHLSQAKISPWNQLAIRKVYDSKRVNLFCVFWYQNGLDCICFKKVIPIKWWKVQFQKMTILAIATLSSVFQLILKKGSLQHGRLRGVALCSLLACLMKKFIRQNCHFLKLHILSFKLV